MPLKNCRRRRQADKSAAGITDLPGWLGATCRSSGLVLQPRNRLSQCKFRLIRSGRRHCDHAFEFEADGFGTLVLRCKAFSRTASNPANHVHSHVAHDGLRNSCSVGAWLRELVAHWARAAAWNAARRKRRAITRCRRCTGAAFRPHSNDLVGGRRPRSPTPDNTG